MHPTQYCHHNNAEHNHFKFMKSTILAIVHKTILPVYVVSHNNYKKISLILPPTEGILLTCSVIMVFLQNKVIESFAQL